jgi:hypothetical protein
VRHGITAALRDPRGGSGKDFWLKLKCGSAEDKRVFANIVARLIPVEVQGDLNESLTVVIKTLVRDEPEMNIPLNGVCTVGEATDRTRIGARDEAETTAPDATP